MKTIKKPLLMFTWMSALAVNFFPLSVGALDRLNWSAIAAPQEAGMPFPVTITARDEFNNVDISFSGTATFSGTCGVITTNSILGSATHSDTYSPGGAYTLGYSFTPNTNLTVTHLRHYFGNKVSIWTDGGTLLAAQAVTSVPGTWVESPLVSPLRLTNGVSYRVGVYFDTTEYSRSDMGGVFPNGTIDANYWVSGDALPVYSLGYRWTFVDLRYTVGPYVAVAIAPINSGNFTNGVWTGNLTVFAPATNTVLMATPTTGYQGTSNPFDVRDTTRPVLTCPIDMVMAALPGECEANVTFNVTATDNVDLAPVVTCVPPSGSSFPVGRTSVLCTAWDTSGNTNTCSFTVSVYPSERSAITTTFNGGNAGGGNMFDVHVLNNPITVRSLDLNLSAATYDLALYVKSGTFVGFNSTPAAWTLIGTVSGVAGNGSGTPTTVDFPDFTLAAGSTNGFYVQSTSGNLQVNYSNGTGLGDVAATNSDLVIFQGYSTPPIPSWTLFSTTFISPRIWNGSIHYDRGITLPLTFVGATNQILEATGPGGAVATFSVTATNTCQPSVPVTCTPPSGSAFPLGTNTVTCLAVDALGQSNTATFTVTVSPVDSFTELFDTSANDLAYRTFTFTPNGTVSLYSICADLAASFPTDPTGGTTVSLGDDDYAQVTLADADTVAIYNRRTNVFFIGSNGYLTMDSGDWTLGESLANHFNRPRVSGCFDDLLPGGGGTITWKQTGDRVAVTFAEVQEFGTSATVSFQIEMFYDGRIRITYLGIGITDGLAGLSAGQGIPAGFVESDFTAYDACGNQSPVVTTQPANQDVIVGGTATFSVTAFGSAPLSYFWRCNDTPIAGASASSYSTNDVQLADSGSVFSCLVSNAYGTAVSSNAWLTVWLLADALDTTNLTWTTGGHANWFGQTNTTHDGVDAAASGTITHNQTNWLQTTVTLPACELATVSFWWQVSSEGGYDLLEFYIDGALQAGRISGTVSWQQKTYTLASGSHTLKWQYRKNGSVNSGADRGWVDQVQVAFAPVPLTFVGATNQIIEATGPSGVVASFSVTATNLCEPNASVTCTPPSGSTFALGTTTVACEAFYGVANTTNFTVTVRDTTPPVLTCPADIVMTADSGQCEALVSFVTPTATDVVDPAPVVTCPLPSGTVLPVGRTNILCTAWDASGNTNTSTFSVWVYPYGGLVTAGEAWTPRESNRRWRSITSSADGTKLVAVVFWGQIYTSTDSGVSWTPRESNREWTSVASSADGSKLVASEQYGQLYTSTNSGTNWTAATVPSIFWFSVASSADGSKLVAAAYNGQVYTSTDSGLNWTPRETIREWVSVASSADGTKLVAGVQGGRIYTSTDSGTNWIARDSSRVWYSVASSADGSKLVAADLGGQIYTSTDSGVTWTPRESNRTWYSVASSADGTRLAAVDNGLFNTGTGLIYTSSDSGITWTPCATNREWMSVASSADGNRLVAGVDYGQIYTSVASSVLLTNAPTILGITNLVVEATDPGGVTVRDATTNHLDGTLVNGAARVFSTRPSTAVAFDGVDDYISVAPNSTLDLTGGTIEFWVNRGALVGNACILGNRGYPFAQTRYSVHMSTTAIGLYNGDTYQTVPVTTTAGQWYHVALVCSGGNTEVFVNGVSRGFTGNAFNPGVSGQPFIVGAIYDNFGNGGLRELFVGQLDEVRVWNVPRNAADIQAAMNQSLTGTEAGLVAYWRFDEGTVAHFSITATNICQPNVPVTCSPPSGSRFPLGTNFVTCVATDAFGVTNTANFTVTVVLPAQPVFAGCRLSTPGQFRMQATGTPGLTYTLQTSTNLVDWVNYTNVVAGPGGLIEYLEDINTNAPACFYRLKWP